MTNRAKQILYCSFCGKSEAEVRKMVAGPTVYICNECAELIADIMKDDTLGDTLRKGPLIDNERNPMEERSKIDELEKMINSGDDLNVTILPDGRISQETTMAAVAADHPMKKAWNAYIATWGYQNSKGWALQIAPMIQEGSRDGEQRRRFEIMPFDQRERYVEGSLWAAFTAGYEARKAE